MHVHTGGGVCVTMRFVKQHDENNAMWGKNIVMMCHRCRASEVSVSAPL